MAAATIQFPMRLTPPFSGLLNELAQLNDSGNRSALIHRLLRNEARQIVQEAVARGDLDANGAAVNEKYLGEDAGLAKNIEILRAARGDFDKDDPLGKEFWGIETDEDGKAGARVLYRKDAKMGNYREVQRPPID